MVSGIYTFANDAVLDQLIALLNSIEANAGREIPVCIIPYNDQTANLRAAIATRPTVTLFDRPDSIRFWEEFAIAAWTSHPTAQRVWAEQGRPPVRRPEFHRKFCSFEGPFDQFVYMDADTLLLGPLDPVFEKLDEYDWVTNDFQYRSDMRLIFNLDSPKLLQTYSQEHLESHIFCAGFFAAKKETFSQEKATEFLGRLQAGEADYMSLRGSDQPLFNAVVLGNGFSFYNFAYHDPEQATGSHWSSTFEMRDHLLFDQGKRLMYLHYMSISPSCFANLCRGEETEIPYRDLFLHYRYLKAPQERPQTFKPPSKLEQTKRAIARFKKLKTQNLTSRLKKLQYQFSKSHP